MAKTAAVRSARSEIAKEGVNQILNTVNPSGVGDFNSSAASLATRAALSGKQGVIAGVTEIASREALKGLEKSLGMNAETPYAQSINSAISKSLGAATVSGGQAVLAPLIEAPMNQGLNQYPAIWGYEPIKEDSYYGNLNRTFSRGAAWGTSFGLAAGPEAVPVGVAAGLGYDITDNIVSMATMMPEFIKLFLSGDIEKGYKYENTIIPAGQQPDLVPDEAKRWVQYNSQYNPIVQASPEYTQQPQEQPQPMSVNQFYTNTNPSFMEPSNQGWWQQGLAPEIPQSLAAR